MSDTKMTVLKKDNLALSMPLVVVIIGGVVANLSMVFDVKSRVALLESQIQTFTKEVDNMERSLKEMSDAARAERQAIQLDVRAVMDRLVRLETKIDDRK